MDMNMDISGEWRCAVPELTEFECCAFDEPQTYSDTMAADGTRLT
jgi:hypothetical protein